MFDTEGTYESVYEVTGVPTRDTIAFYEAQDGGQFGIGDVDPDGWRMIINARNIGGVMMFSYTEINAETGKVEGRGKVHFDPISNTPNFTGSWNTPDLEGPWKLTKNV